MKIDNTAIITNCSVSANFEPLLDIVDAPEFKSILRAYTTYLGLEKLTIGSTTAYRIKKPLD